MKGLCGGMGALVLAALAGPAAAQAPEGERLLAAVAALCAAGDQPPAEVAGFLRGAREPWRAGDRALGARWVYADPTGARLHVEQLAPGGTLRRWTVQYDAPAAGGARPAVLVVADAGCAVRQARRLRYGDGPVPVGIEGLDAALRPTGVSEPLDPPVPPGTDPGGVPVALVDAGVNYLLPRLGRRLARDGAGAILGFDFWDMDPRPFDANPARSPFFPQRHGTRTASLLLAEAPVARLVPYRYPRPDMGRMAALVADAAAKGVRIVNLSLGSPKRADWEAFEAAAGAHPDILFVASAGNEGRDIDAEPVYPAALALPNLLTVSSAEADGRLARGSNFGARGVHLLVPAEHQGATDFSGEATLVSGSSYAAVRVSALAACLLAAHPHWRAPALRAAILARAVPSAEAVAHGFIPEPVSAGAGACEPIATDLAEVERYPLDAPGAAGPQAALRLAPSVVVMRGSGWPPARVRGVLGEAARILGRCGIRVEPREARVIDGPPRFRRFREATARELARWRFFERPAIYFLEDTLRPVPYGAEAFGRANTPTRPELRNTVWMTRDVPDPGISLAHELFHVLADSGGHVDDPRNLMHETTEAGGSTLTGAQCARIREQGRAAGLLAPVP